MKNATKQTSAVALLVAFISGAPVSTRAQKVKTGTAAASKFDNVDAITKSDLHDWLTLIASDEQEARDTPSRGLDIAAKYITRQLANWGILPGAREGTYIQKFPLKKSLIVPADSKLEL